MVEQVLEFAGVQSGRKTYHRAEVLVSELVDDALAASTSLIDTNEITVEVDDLARRSAGDGRFDGLTAVAPESDRERSEIWRDRSLARRVGQTRRWL